MNQKAKINMVKSVYSRLVLFLLIFQIHTFVFAKEFEEPKVLRICADPYMLPFSNTKEQGYENKIAELLARELDVPLEYEWFPQRMGFIRNTLRADSHGSKDGSGYKCDLVLSVPSGFELAAATRPYYRTAYVLVYVKGQEFDAIESPNQLKQFVESRKFDLKFGLTDRGPGQLWLFYEDLLTYMVPYQGHPGDPRWHPGKLMMEELAAGKIDMAIIWGPTAGYYAKKFKEQEGIEFSMLPMKENNEHPEARFVYDMSMAVRYGEKVWKQKIEQLIAENRKEIERILVDFGVPLLSMEK